MILGVTGPNEYENNINNNWYTNTMAAWTLEYTLQSLQELERVNPQAYQEKWGKLELQIAEIDHWREIIGKMYYPRVEELGIFEQNDGYMDKEQKLVKDVPPEELPLNKHWSWDQILRSCFIKQADVIQGIYFFPERYDTETVRRNFDFYEPRTVHESSLSPSIYSIVASRIGYYEKAYELYLRTARLDLDNYNDDSEDGVHLTSMAGSWSAIVQGFADIRVSGGQLSLHPYLPEHWQSYGFKLTFRGRRLKITIVKDEVRIEQLTGPEMMIKVGGKDYASAVGKTVAAGI